MSNQKATFSNDDCGKKLPSPTGRGVGGEGKSALPAQLLAFARKLRTEQTDAFMWAILRDRRFCGLKFRRQHPVAPYVDDFFCHDYQFAVELDGGQHNTTQTKPARKMTSARHFWQSKESVSFGFGILKYSKIQKPCW